jgi:UDP-glucose:(heptosyl)LPS alpha-1,3-glucosyltransferase
MRVAIVIDDLDRRRGGMSEWCWQFVCATARRGYDLHVIAQGFGQEPLPSQISRHRIARTNSRQAFAQEAADLLRNLRPDVIHDTGIGWHFDIFQPHGGSYAAWLERRLDMYPWWFRAAKRPIDALLPRHRDFARHARQQCAATKQAGKIVIALSNLVADDYQRRHGIHAEQIKVIYNGVDCQRFSPAHRTPYRALVRRNLGVADNALLLLLAAHNFRLKGVPELLALAARLNANKRPAHVVIAGGKRLERWRSSAKKLGLADRVSFVGTISNLVPYYAAADAYVHPTYYDPCSLVLLEAAASGLPIVTTRRYNGAVELFCEDEEILVANDPTAASALYERVDALFDDHIRAKLSAASRRVALRNPIERNVAEIVRLYETRGRRRIAA